MRKLLILPTLGAQIALERRTDKRLEAAYIASARANAHAKVLALAGLMVPIATLADSAQTRLRWLSFGEVQTIGNPGEIAFLGEDENAAPLFACNFEAPEADPAEAAFEEIKPLIDLRSLARQGVLNDSELLIASQARALMAWHGVTRFCSRCGSPVSAKDAGWRMHCEACGLSIYPRVDPAVIMLITYGGRCLMGREHRFPEKLYSALAGFVEPGDDIEHAVRREVKEETGVDVGQVRYVASQPWPFPHSLMIGCWGEALNGELAVNTAEIADARWFSREEAASMLDNSHPEGLEVPPALSIAHTLVRAFVDGNLAG